MAQFNKNDRYTSVGQTRLSDAAKITLEKGPMTKDREMVIGYFLDADKKRVTDAKAEDIRKNGLSK